MNESHLSLRDLYEVTGDELDTLACEAWKIPGVLGSRMTEAGFGGSTVYIVKEETVEEFKEKVGKNYTGKIGYSPHSMYVTLATADAKLNKKKALSTKLTKLFIMSLILMTPDKVKSIPHFPP